jgi:hypothetical protein
MSLIISSLPALSQQIRKETSANQFRNSCVLVPPGCSASVRRDPKLARTGSATHRIVWTNTPPPMIRNIRVIEKIYIRCLGIVASPFFQIKTLCTSHQTFKSQNWRELGPSVYSVFYHVLYSIKITNVYYYTSDRRAISLTAETQPFA